MSDLAIPSKVLDQHLVCLGKTGAGKSSVLRHIVEHLLSHKKRVCIIDPKGDWWGPKLSSTIGLIERRAGVVRPTEVLFPPGLS